MTSRSLRAAIGALMVLASLAVPAAEEGALDVQTVEPRAFGYQVGDHVQRRVSIRVPPGLTLDANTLPRPGARGAALELRSLQRRSDASAQREELVLDYQVFFSPVAVRTLELPPFTLRFTGTPREQDLRIDAWPVTVAPLVPLEVSPRRGLGELQPDEAPPPIDTAAVRQRLGVWAIGGALLVAYLLAVYVGLPGWRRHQRPFARAWRDLRALPAAPADAAWQAACKRVHAALDATAGNVLFERDVPAFAERHRAFAGLREDIGRFLQMSRREFFADGGRAPGDAAWLVAFCRRCRDAERGT